jgi:GMP synthase-like glutamine amidotransferase
MKPIAIFRHSPTEGPGYFASYLDARGIPWRLVDAAGGETIPADPGAFAGLTFMGGPMSVNDTLRWIAPELELIRRAVAAGVPCLGHCLGGQLMSKALGGAVTRNAVKEIGWGMVQAVANPEAEQWLGGLREFFAFHWHGETFSIPDGATRILGNAHCANQAFVLGKHLGMQTHVEMTPDMIRAWYANASDEVTPHAGPSVQTAAEAAERLVERVRALNAVAARLYDRWVEGLAP